MKNERKKKINEKINKNKDKIKSNHNHKVKGNKT